MSSWNGTSGDWGNGALWTPVGEPGAGAGVDIGASGTFTITFETGDYAALSNAYGYNSAATFAMSGGTFAADGWTWYGSFGLSGGLFYVSSIDPDWYGPASQTGGVLDLQTGFGYGATFEDGLQQSAGTVNVLEGLLKLEGTSTLDGTVQGPGGGLYVADEAVVTLGNAGTVATALLELNTGSDLVLAPGAAGVQGYAYDNYLEVFQGATLNSQGQNFTLGSGGEAYFEGSFTGGGVFDVLGEADLGGMVVTGDGTSVQINGDDFQDNLQLNIGVASADVTGLTIGQGGTLTNAGGGEISGNQNGALIVLGVFAVESPQVDGTTQVDVQTLNLAGTIEIGGVLELTGPEAGAKAILAGLIDGSGELEIGNLETVVLNGPTALDAGSIDLAYGGEILLNADETYDGAYLYGTGTLDTNGDVFTLGTAATGNFGNVIDGGGTVVLASDIGSLLAFAPVLVGQGTELLITGDVNAGETSGSGDILLGQYGVTYATQVSITATGTLNTSIAGGVQGYGQAAFYNAGLVETSATPSYAGPAFSGLTFGNTGTIDITTGYAELNLDTAAIGGLIEGPGELYLNGGTVRLLAGLQLDNSSLLWAGSQILLEGDLNYGGQLQEGLGGTFNLQGYTFSVTNGALDEYFTGGGTVVTEGVIDGGPGSYGNGIWLLGTGTTLLDDYVIIEDNKSLALGEFAGNSGTLSIATGALFDIVADSGIATGSSTGDVIFNQGTFEVDSIFPLAAEVPGSAFVSAASFVNRGVIEDVAGVLPITATLVNDGLVTVSGTTEIFGPVVADPGDAGNFVIGQGAELAFTGAFLVNPVDDGPVAASQTIGFAGDAGTLLIEAPNSFAGTILGFTAGDIISVDVPLDGPGAANTFGYDNADGMLTLYHVSDAGTSLASTVALGTLDVPGIDAADLQLIYDDVLGGTDIVLNNNPTGPAAITNGAVLNATWLGPNGANWDNPADWATEYIDPMAQTNPQIENAVPPQGYEIVLPASLALAFDVASTPGGEFTAHDISSVPGSTLDVSGGTLAASYGINDAGTVSISAGTLELISGFEYNFIGVVSLTGTGVLRVDDGDVVIGNNGSSYYYTSNSIDGTLAGAGELVLGETGTFALGPADVLAVSVLDNAGDTTLEGNQVFQGQTFINQYLLDLNGDDFLAPVGTTVEMPAGTMTGGGTFQIAGVGDFGGSVSGAGTELLVTGTAFNGGDDVQVINSGAVVSIGLTGTLVNPLIGGTAGTLVNNGLIVLTTGFTPYDQVGLYEELREFYDNAGSDLDIEAGNMELYGGTATLAGDIYGGGMLELDANIATLAAVAELDVASLELSSATLTLEQSLAYNGTFAQYFGTLNTNGDTLVLGGNVDAGSSGVLDGAISGGGVVVANGNYFASGLGLTGAGTELLDTGYIAVGSGGFRNGLETGDATVFSIGGSGELAFYGPDNALSSGYGADTFNNAGLVQLAETGNNILETSSFINTGVIDLPYSQLEIEANYGVLGGQVTGPGELYLSEEGYAGGTFVLSPGLSLAVGTLYFQDGDFQLDSGLTYAGDFVEFNPTLNTNLYDLDLSGEGLLAGTLIGGGAVTVAGSFQASAAYLWGAQTTLDVTGTLELGSDGLAAGSQNTAGTGAILHIGTGGVLDIAGDGNVGSEYSYSNFTLDNAGTIEKTGDFGSTTISAVSFINTGRIEALHGYIAITGTLVNDGTVFEGGFGGLDAGSITGAGVIIIDPASTTISGAVGAGQQVSFAGAGGTLVLTDATQFAGTITGFGADDFIDLSNVATAAITGETYANGTLAIIETSGSINIAFADPAPPGDLTLSSDGGSGTVIEQAICYLHGTRILTPKGEVPVEALAIGDVVVSRRAGLRAIKWLGRQAYAPRFIQANRAKMPVRIRAGALGQDLPRRDLFVSPGHSMLLGDTLVLARNLVNGVTVTQELPEETVRYVQLEFEDHDCVLAEGCWSESYADAPGLRAQFHNAAEFARLYPEAVAREALQLCAPRPEEGEALAAALAPVVARAWENVAPGPLEGWLDDAGPRKITGWALDRAHPELPVWLDIWENGRQLGRVLACDYRGDLAEAGKGQGRCAFNFECNKAVEPAALRVTRVGTDEALALTQRCAEERRVLVRRRRSGRRK